MPETTYGNLKRRVFDFLFEYISPDDTVFIADTDRELILSRLPDAVNTSLVRMYESLPVGVKKSVQKVLHPSMIFSYNGICDKDKGVEFELSCSEIGVFFRYFGRGTVKFSDIEGNILSTLECEGNGSMSCRRSTLDLNYTGICSVSVEGNLCIKNIAVYEFSSTLVPEQLCAFNERSFELPADFERLVSAECRGIKISGEMMYVCNGYGFIGSGICGEESELAIEYKRKPYTVCEQTKDDFNFEITLLEFEALVCLVASELCRNENADLYTRLMYKYNDFCEGIKNIDTNKKSRNTFFAAKTKRRW